jgi:hypothetical protein
MDNSAVETSTDGVPQRVKKIAVSRTIPRRLKVGGGREKG